MDDWEDEDDEFAVNPPRAFKAPVSSAESWEDEDEVEIVVKSAAPSAAQLEATAKKVAEEEIRMANVLKFAILEDETPDEKRARERKQIEEADADLAGELFGGGKSGGTTSKAAPSFSSGVAAVNVKSKADHTSFGILCAKKLSDSNSFNVAAFYKSFTEKIQKNMTTESCDEILAILQKIRDEKKKAEPVKVVVAAKKSKSQIKAEAKKHSDVFGGGDGYDDRFDDYNAMEDDYM